MSQEVSPSEFLKQNTNNEPEPRPHEIEDEQGRYIVVDLYPVERDELFDELSNLPPGFLNAMLSGTDVENVEDIEDPEDVNLEANEMDIFAHIDGSVFNVFESLFALSARNPELTSMDMETLAGELDFDSLFEAGGEIIDVSLEDTGSIKGFRKAGSGKSS